MKKRLLKISLSQNAEILNDNEMKQVVGGYSGYCKCAYNTDYNKAEMICMPGGCDIDAEFMAGKNGHWECNTDAVLHNCK